MPPPRVLARAAAVLLAAALSACSSGPSSSGKRAVNAMLAAQNYEGALKSVELRKVTDYGRKNAVLYYLDKGMILHHAGRYKEADQDFDQAETRMDELYTKSITKSGGMLLLNDNTVDYAGEPFERALLNVFRALNYVFLGQPQEALVEARKVEAFLDELNRNLEKKNRYKDDAFARYLDSLLYADLGQADDARISRHAAEEAYGWYATDYNTPSPRFPVPDQPADGKGELVFIHYNGPGPRKVSKTLQLAWGNALALTKSTDEAGAKDQTFRNALTAGVAGKAITVAFPDYTQDPYSVAGSEVFVDSAPAGTTVLMEDVSAIAAKNLKDRQALIWARAVARATVKYVLAESAVQTAAKTCDKQFGAGTLQAKICVNLSRATTHGLAAGTEAADIRSWATVPSQIRMARIALPPGRHHVSVRFKDGGGAVLSTVSFDDVMIKPGKRTYLNHRTAN